ncbi:MAG: hypothetical protein Q8P56_01840 [Candidatus Uhrbacteria bacterium]|nr:hypothetical protein [Candidatus Uhrbacteria bacterium]
MTNHGGQEPKIQKPEVKEPKVAECEKIIAQMRSALHLDSRFYGRIGPYAEEVARPLIKGLMNISENMRQEVASQIIKNSDYQEWINARFSIDGNPELSSLKSEIESLAQDGGPIPERWKKYLADTDPMAWKKR